MSTTIKAMISSILLMHAASAWSDDLFVYPAQGQSADQMAIDKANCWEWAKKETNYDPANPPKAEAAPAEKADAKVGRGVARGALAGSLLANSVGGNRTAAGAAGAMLGAAKESKKADAQQAQMDQAAEQQAQAGVEQQRNTYNRAYAACLEAKGYSTK